MTIALFTVIDLETTGLAPPASVVEIGWTRVYLDTETKAVEVSPPQSRLFSPAEPQTPEVVAVHHLTDEMLKGYERCTDDDLIAVATEDAPQFIVAANSAFETQWFTPEILKQADGRMPHIICTVKAAARLHPEAESHSNQAMRYRLGLDLPDELAMPPHRAGPDSYVTAHILATFIRRGVRVSDLVRWTFEPKLMTRCPIGKEWRGKPWADVDAGFLDWILRQQDMEADIAHWARIELERRRNAA
jgi:exodeoxyribonuclease X